MFLYKYEGPVNRFGKCITSHWTGYSYAVSEAKAKSNLAYQFKKQFGLMVNTKLAFPGKLTLEVPEKRSGQISMIEYLKSVNKDTTELIALMR